MAEVRRQTSGNGLSVLVPESFRRSPEHEVEPVVLALGVDPWPWPDGFRPVLTVEARPLTPDRGTLPQLSVEAIESEFSNGRHVVACDLWGEEDPHNHRRIVSVYTASETTVLHLIHITVCGNRAITVSMHHGVGHCNVSQKTFDLAVASLEHTFDDPPVQVDPATMPPIDSFASVREPEPLEHLGGLRLAPPIVGTATELREDQVKALHRGRLRRGTDAGALQAGGFVTDRGRLTEAGQRAHRALGAPARRLTIEVRSDDQPRAAGIVVYLAQPLSAVLATIPPGSGRGHPDAPHSVDLIPPDTAPVTLVRWLGLAPTWAWGITDSGGALSVDRSILVARLDSPDTPSPPGANDVLTRMWRSPWQVATITSTAAGSGRSSVIAVPAVGYFEIASHESPERALVRSLPSASYLRLLLGLGGLDLSD